MTGFTPVAEMLSERMDHVKFIIPSAPSRPVTMNRGMHMPAWYDIVGLDDRSAESCDGLVESRRMVHQLLEQEAAAGIKYERMVVAGFSQGGALTLHAGLQLDSAEKQLAGLIVMSGGCGLFIEFLFHDTGNFIA
jgi:predicted esterase